MFVFQFIITDFFTFIRSIIIINRSGATIFATLCTSLTDLNLQSNGISDVGCAALVALPLLAKLSLRGNAAVGDVGAIALSRGCRVLKTLNLSRTALTEAGVAALLLTAPTSANCAAVLDGKDAPPAQGHFVAARTARTLIELRVKGARMKAVPPAARRVLLLNVCNEHCDSRGVCTLAALTPPLGDDGAEVVAEILLNRLMNRNVLDDDASASRPGFAGVVTIDLRRNMIGKVGGAALLSALCRRGEPLRSLLTTDAATLLEDARCGTIPDALEVVGETAPPLLLSMDIRKNPDLNETSLSRRLAGCIAVNALAAESSSTSLLSFGASFRSASDRNLGDEGAAVVAAYISRRSVCPATLRELGLHYNNIGAVGCDALARALASNSTLTDLSLYSNAPGAHWGRILQGVAAMAAGGASSSCSSSLTALDLGGNRIGDEGARTLSISLCENTMLTDLHLDFNAIGMDGIAALEDALRTNTTLCTLWLHGNPALTLARTTTQSAASETMTSIRSALRRNRTDLQLREGVPPRSPSTAWSELLVRGMRTSAAYDRCIPVVDAGGSEPVSSEDRAGADSLRDRIARAALEAYRSRFANHWNECRGQSVLTAFAFVVQAAEPGGGEEGEGEEEGASLFIAALGVGTKWVDPELFAGSKDGEAADSSTAAMELVRDSHAEVLARRSLLRYLYAEVARCLHTDDSRIFARSRGGDSTTTYCGTTRDAEDDGGERSQKEQEKWYAMLRPGITLALYTSTAPCGKIYFLVLSFSFSYVTSSR